uniref:Ephrin RBD domain-containing protein n=1 Tax=Glossina austeni TaxID=7395 RepID=A0A1A9V5P9_GLOAU
MRVLSGWSAYCSWRIDEAWLRVVHSSSIVLSRLASTSALRRFRIDNTDHIIDVNKGNLAFEFDQVHIICPVYEPGTFDNETEKYIIYNVSKVEYETCRITNADPRVIAICDKPQKLMFFTITFRPFTPQPGGLEFLPGNDYYFISTSSKDDLYRRIGGRCSTNNMKVVFKVCCAPEEKNKTTTSPQMIGGNKNNGGSPGASVQQVVPTDIGTASVEDPNGLTNVKNLHAPHNNINVIGVNGMNSGVMPNGVLNINNGGNNNNGMQVNPVVNSPSSTSINTNVDQFNRIPIQTNNLNVLGNNIGANNVGLGSHGSSIILTHGNSGVNMIPTGGIGVIGQYPSHGYHGQSGIRINNVPSSHHINHKNSNGKDENVKEVSNYDGTGLMEIGFGNNYFIPPIINTNHSNIVQSTLNWPVWGKGDDNTTYTYKPNNISSNSSQENTNIFSPTSHKPTNKKGRTLLIFFSTTAPVRALDVTDRFDNLVGSGIIPLNCSFLW